MQLRALSQYHASPSDTLSRQCPFDLYNLDKYILEFGQIHLTIGTNTFCNLDKYILQFVQIHLRNCRPPYPSITLSRQCPFDLWAHQMDITDAVRIWTPCHNDHIAYVATMVSYNGDGNWEFEIHAILTTFIVWREHVASIGDAIGHYYAEAHTPTHLIWPTVGWVTS